MTPEQCRAARGLLHWSQTELGERADYYKTNEIHRFECRIAKYVNVLMVAKLTETFEDAGVRFLGDKGVTLDDDIERRTRTGGMERSGGGDR